MDKRNLIKNLNAERMTPVGRNLSELIDVMVSEIRVDNDTAGLDIVPINQGKIMGLLGLKDYLLKDPV